MNRCNTFLEVAIGEVFFKKSVLNNFANFTQKNTCVGISLLKRDSSTGAFLRICKIFKNAYFEEHLQTTGSAFLTLI